MKNPLRLLLLSLCWTACQSSDPAVFGVDPQLSQYTDEAPMTRKLFCNSVNCENPLNQEVYAYDQTGKLTRMEQWGRMASGALERYAYTDYHYDPSGLLIGKTGYGLYGSDNRWVATAESEYSYAQGVLTEERTYYHQHNPEQRVLTGLVTYDIQDGLKVGQRWYDDQQKLSRRVVNEYRNKVLIRETWLDASDTPFRRFDHQFAGNRRQVVEHLPGSTEQISMVEKTYDSQGRLSSEETKVINPLLCAMQAGIIRYLY
ncbi:hypothetical protein [Spirosoma koreense]